jgi:hypothetical protein
MTGSWQVDATSYNNRSTTPATIDTTPAPDTYPTVPLWLDIALAPANRQAQRFF